MVGLGLMQSLIDALPDGGRLLLVGDAGQLPSVQAGAVFHELSDRSEAPPQLRERIWELTENYRVSEGGKPARIVEVAGRIREGDADVATLVDDGLMEVWADFSPDVAAAPGVHFCTVGGGGDDANAESGGGRVEDFVQAWTEAHFGDLWPAQFQRSDDETHWYRREALFDHREGGGFTDEARRRIAQLFDTVAACQLLTITRVGDRGSRALNRRIHRRYRAAHGLAHPRWMTFEPGEPVIITRNDYTENVFNGEQAVVLYTRRPTEGGFETAKKRVVVPDGTNEEGEPTFRAVSFHRLKDKLEHAYALTVHKSQGSEYDHVGVVLPRPVDAPDRSGEQTVHPLMTRQILYTALTRAKSSAVVVGSPDVFDQSVTRSAGRYSGICRRLAQLTTSRAPEEANDD